MLSQARLAIDALGCLVDGLEGRLGEAEEQLKDGLSQLRLAYVQIDGAQRAGAEVASARRGQRRSRPAMPEPAPADLRLTNDRPRVSGGIDGSCRTRRPGRPDAR